MNHYLMHVAGLLFEAQSLHNEAIIAFSFSLSIEPYYVPSIMNVFTWAVFNSTRPIIKLAKMGMGRTCFKLSKACF
jgi:hypothetical protein